VGIHGHAVVVHETAVGCHDERLPISESPVKRSVDRQTGIRRVGDRGRTDSHRRASEASLQGLSEGARPMDNCSGNPTYPRMDGTALPLQSTHERYRFADKK